VLALLPVWSEMQTCIWPSWCHCHSLSPASVKSRLVLPFWYRLTRVVPETGPLNGCVFYNSSNQSHTKKCTACLFTKTAPNSARDCIINQNPQLTLKMKLRAVHVMYINVHQADNEMQWKTMAGRSNETNSDSPSPTSGTSPIGSIDSPLSSSITPSLYCARLKPSYSAIPRHRSLPFLLQDWVQGFPRLFTDTSEHIRFYCFFSPLFRFWFCAVD